MNDPGKELRLLFAFFGDSKLPAAEFVPAHRVPDPFKTLLVHEQHMTVVLERRHGATVKVTPWRVHHLGDLYGRMLDLHITGSGRMVMTGVMLVNLTILSEEATERILAGTTPLGKVLIDHTPLRTVTPTQFFKLPPTDPLAVRFGSTTGRPAWGRLATIHLDGNPAVDLLEIVHPDEH